eukprot:3089005-Rhodomonas_salina.4
MAAQPPKIPRPPLQMQASINGSAASINGRTPAHVALDTQRAISTGSHLVVQHRLGQYRASP